MKTNESVVDRIIRIVFGLVLFVLFFANVVTGVWGYIFLVLGAVALITGLVGYCPLYSLLKIQTNKK